MGLPTRAGTATSQEASGGHCRSAIFKDFERMTWLQGLFPGSEAIINLQKTQNGALSLSTPWSTSLGL